MGQNVIKIISIAMILLLIRQEVCAASYLRPLAANESDDFEAQWADMRKVHGERNGEANETTYRNELMRLFQRTVSAINPVKVERPEGLEENYMNFASLLRLIVDQAGQEDIDFADFTPGNRLKGIGIYYPSNFPDVAALLEHIGITSDDNLLEVGSADSSLSCFLAHYFTGKGKNIRATAVEVWPNYHKLAVFLKDSLVDSNYIREDQVSLVNKSFLDDGIDFADYSLIFYFSRGTESKRGLLEKMLKVRKGCRIIIYGSYEPEIESVLFLNPFFKMQEFVVLDEQDQGSSYARVYTKAADIKDPIWHDSPKGAASAVVDAETAQHLQRSI